MTQEQKAWIDNASYTTLLERWRFAPAGDPLFQGQTGEYYKQRMAELRNQPGGNEQHVAASKTIGWR